MGNYELKPCLKCHSKNVDFVLVSTNSKGGEVFKIKCESCGLTSVDESIKERLVNWWNDRKPAMPPDNFNILVALGEVDKEIEKKGHVNKSALRDKLKTLQEELGIVDKGGSSK